MRILWLPQLRHHQETPGSNAQQVLVLGKPNLEEEREVVPISQVRVPNVQRQKS